ncbi:hypothetical protein [Legionella brunensis]|uniref:Uncharacterized protein n=1 Tax=Legionella brunensis TaxID=29422 RepID=A0A0W0SEN9_9GAMM|nr:hypothetical protein [Legionella brunensis]KTC81565.1 hypothetical protein Lbru_2085 [Legionella brunensis]
MFFLKKKTKYKDKEFDIFDNKINHVSYGARRQFSKRTYDESYLWTSNLTACVGVGLVYQEGKSSMLELYHSAGEHNLEYVDIKEALEKENDFVSMLFHFLKQIDDTRGLTIYVACDPMHSNPERDERYIYEALNKCIKYINQSQSKSLPPVSFTNIKSIEVQAGTFFVTTTGKTGTIVEALSESLSEIRRLFADEKSLGNSALYGEYLKLNTKIEGKELDSFATEKSFFENLQQLASDFLSTKHSSQEYAAEKLAIKLVSWNLFLNKPDKQLFKSWQEKHVDTSYEPPSP